MCCGHGFGDAAGLRDAAGLGVAPPAESARARGAGVWRQKGSPGRPGDLAQLAGTVSLTNPASCCTSNSSQKRVGTAEPRELAGLRPGRPGTPRSYGSRAGGGGSAIRPSGVVFSLSLSCVWREAGLQPREAKGLGRAGQGGAAPLHPFPPPLPGGRPGAPPSGTAPAGCTAHQLFF